MARSGIKLGDLHACASQIIPNIVISSIAISSALVADAPEPAQSILAQYTGWTALVYALPITDEVLWAWHHANGTRYLFANYVLERLTTALRQFVTPMGIDTVDVAITFPGSLSLVELAVRAGIGSRGVNNLLLHHKFGSWLQLHALFADCSVSGSEPTTWDVCTKCGACVESCPASAIEMDRFFPRRCSVLVAAPWMPKSKAIALTSSSYIECAECIRQCPVGASAEGLFQWRR